MRFLSPLLPFVTIATLAIAGCAASPDLVKTGVVKTNTVENRSVEIMWISVHATDNGTEISGRIHRRPLVEYPLNGHVIVTAVAADGSSLGEVTANLSQPSIPYKANRSSSFFAILPRQLPEGSTIRVRYSTE